MSILKGLKLNSANARGFLFFLLLTTIVAAIIKLSKTYEIDRNLDVVITNLPLDRTVSGLDPETFQVEAQTSGFSILRNSFNGKELEIPFDQLESKGKGSYTFETSEHKTTIQRALAKDANLVNVRPRVLKIIIDSLSSKLVPVIPRTNITYATGFNAASAVSVKPDSITVVGPSQILEKINVLQTITVTNPDASESIKETVAVDIDSLPDVLKFSDKEVFIEQDITRFTEGTVTVPITVLNDPDKKVKILPKNVKIVYNVALDSFENIGASDFQVTCDYAKANAANDYLTLTIEREPKIARGTRLSTKQVKYIVVN